MSQNELKKNPKHIKKFVASHVVKEFFSDFILLLRTRSYRLFAEWKPRVPVYMFSLLLSYYAMPEYSNSFIKFITSQKKKHFQRRPYRKIYRFRFL